MAGLDVEAEVEVEIGVVEVEVELHVSLVAVAALSRASQGDFFFVVVVDVVEVSALLSLLGLLFSSNVSIKIWQLFSTLLLSLCVVDTMPSSSSAPDPEALLRIDWPRRRGLSTLDSDGSLTDWWVLQTDTPSTTVLNGAMVG